MGVLYVQRKNAKFLAENAVFGPKFIFLEMLQIFLTIVTGHPIGNIFVLTLSQGWPLYATPNLVGPSRPPKMTNIDNGFGPGWNWRKRWFLRYAQQRKTGQNSCIFSSKKHQNSAKRLIFIWEKGTFFFAQLCPVVARTLLESRSESFVSGPKIQTLAQKFGFLPKNPSFCYRISDF